MATSVEMPELGESVTEGTITTWLKKVGDTVEVDEPLLEVSTDKVDTEIPSPVAGVLLEILAEEDDTVDVGEVIAKIGDEDESGDSGSDDSADEAEEDEAEEAAEDEAADDEKSEDKSEKPKKSGGSGKATDVEMPELGESVTEGTITTWLKEVGDTVEVDEPLLEVSTDKVDTEIPSPVAGTLVEVLAEVDDTVDVGAVIARIGDADAAASDDSDDSDDEDADVPSEEAIEESESKDDNDTVEEAKDDSADEEKKSEKPKKSGGSGKASDVEMPELGESVTEGTITSWLKEVGDTVEVDEPLLEVSTDKVDTEIPSPVAGTLIEVLFDVDDTVDVGAVIARVGDADAADDGDDAEVEAAEAAAEEKEEPKKKD